ncbi:MAG: nitroreductase family protein [Ilumatobacter sp.]|jgi:nitroreductase|uniref:nitroreductase family protein n=1 Tax=Ilumatobacter sp. TaxID=1967498 RepID=UPI00391D11BC
MSDHPTLGLSADDVLTTTRSVRKRLDLTREVPRQVLIDCIDIAHQSPTGSNSQRWRWVIVEDAAKRAKLAEIYKRNFDAYAGGNVFEPGSQQARVHESAVHLAENLQHVPVHVIPVLADKMDVGTPSSRQASRWGGILPAVWSFMLALRERGLGSAWTTLHLQEEELAAELLGIPFDTHSQAGLFPVAYTIGTDFKPAKRPPAETFIKWNEWSDEPT